MPTSPVSQPFDESLSLESTNAAKGVGMFRGSCLCRGVQFEITGAIHELTHCHCSMCRKAHGAAFATFAVSNRGDYRLVKGEELVTRYASSSAFDRAFCRVCGSRAPSKSRDGKLYFVPAGLLDDDPGVKPALHIFVGSKAPWWDITDDLPQFEKWVPGYGPDDQR